MNCNAGEVALAQQLVQLVGTYGALDEDDHLVELEAVQQLVKLPVLLRLAELDVVLLQSVQGELRVIVDVHLQRVPHELLANRSDLLRERRAEHHHLLVGRGRPEDLLDVTAHVCKVSEILNTIQKTYQLGPASCRTRPTRKP